jgi:hypothetical protein
VTNDADSCAKKATHEAISAGVPLRPIGPAVAAADSNSSCEPVSTYPGATTLTVTPRNETVSAAMLDQNDEGFMKAQGVDMSVKHAPIPRVGEQK